MNWGPPIFAERVRAHPLGFGPLAMKSGERHTFKAGPLPANYRPDLFTIPGAIADSFRVLEILVGKKRQVLTPDGLPGHVFRELHAEHGTDFTYDTLLVGQVIEVEIECVIPDTFKAIMRGALAA
jgi:hypothetical protein